MSNICIFNNDGFSVVHFRSRLIKDLVDQGNNVTVLVPSSRFDGEIKKLGVTLKTIRMSRFINPFMDILLLARLYKFFKYEHFDIVHNMTIKPNIFGTLVANLCGVKRIVCLVPGAGFIFSESSDKLEQFLKTITLFLYRYAMKLAKKVWFQNQEDMIEFVEKGIIKQEQGVVIRSSGVDINKYNMESIDSERSLFWEKTFQIRPDEYVVLMVTARLIKSKGVMEFLEAAEILAGSEINYKFILIAPSEDNTHDEINPKIFKESVLENFIYYSEFIDDIHNVISVADVVVLPSYYREGVPRILLEGMALSKPLITTNSVGCKEAVKHDFNGFLIQPKNSGELAEKLQLLTQTDELAATFSANSRRLACEEFSDKLVSSQVMAELYLINKGEMNG